MTRPQPKVKYEKIIVFSPCVLEGVSDPFPNLEGGSYVGGQIRMQATLKACRIWPDAEFVMLGGMAVSKVHPSSLFKKAEVMARFVKQHCAWIRPIVVNSLPCTRHNMIALFNKFGNELISGRRVAVLSNLYHRERIMRFWVKGREEFGYSQIADPDFISAEELVSSNGIMPKYADALKKREESEKQGLLDIENGVYRDHCLEKLALISLLLKSELEFGYALTPDEQSSVLTVR